MHEAEQRATGFFSRLALAAIACAGAALVLLAMVEAWQVFARYVLNDTPSWTEPVALLLMKTAVMLGAAAAVRRNSHFGFFILVNNAPRALRRWLSAAALLVSGGIGLVLAVTGAGLMIDGWQVAVAGAPLPAGALYIPFAIGGALIAVFAIEGIVHRPTDDSTPGGP